MVIFATHALGQIMYLHHVGITCHKAIVAITG